MEVFGKFINNLMDVRGYIKVRVVKKKVLISVVTVSLIPSVQNSYTLAYFLTGTGRYSLGNTSVMQN